MRVRIYILLFFSGLIVPIIISNFQPIPGYLDSDYYYAGGMQLVAGNGFSEPYLWNYLDDPEGLPHPSHAYWMPLASIISAFGMWLLGQTTYGNARIFFILLAACVPPITTALAYTFSHRKDLAIISGLLAVFPAFFAPFLPVADNFGILMVLGGLFYLVAKRKGHWFWLGIISGLMTLARNDGLLWLVIASGLLILQYQSKGKLSDLLTSSGLLIIGFLMTMGPWYIRNVNVYGLIFPPGGERTLWLANYEQTFSYPANQLTSQSWLTQGWSQIIQTRIWALGQNLQNAFAAQGAIVLLPFIFIGGWRSRSDRRVQSAIFGWSILLLVMTVFFPFAGARGGFFHAGAAFQPLWWALAPLGLEAVIQKAIQQGRFKESSKMVFQFAAVQILILLTIYVAWMRLFKLGWGEGEKNYLRADSFLVENGASPEDVVIVRNPPGYFMLTGRPAIVIPEGDKNTILAVAQKFEGRFLIFEPQALLPGNKELYDSPENQGKFHYLGELNGIRIFEIQDH